MIHFFVDNYQK